MTAAVFWEGVDYVGGSVPGLQVAEAVLRVIELLPE